MFKAILVLPFNAAVTIPAVLLWLTREFTFAAPMSGCFWVAFILLGAGMSLFVTTVVLFVKFGHGTLVPWYPGTHPRNSWCVGHMATCAIP